MITRDDAPNCKLSSLARLFNASTTPNHRALSDARATVDVLHGLMERLGGLGVHTLEELQTLLVAGHHRPAQQAPPRRGAAPTPPASTSSATTAPGSSTSAPRATCAPGSVLLHRLRDALPDGRDGRARRLGDRDRVRDHAGGRGPRAAADRRAQAALQPALPLPREGPLPQADPRAVAAAVAGPAGARRRRRLPRPVLVPQDRGEVPGRAARHVPGPPVLRPAAAASRSRSPCVLAEMGRCLAPCDGSVDDADVRRRGPPAARHPGAPPRRGGRGDQRPDGRSRRHRALRGGRHPPRPAGGLRARRVAHPAADAP